MIVALHSRASADFGTAKEYLREAIAIAERLEDPVAVADRHGDLGTTFRSEGRFTDALTHQKKQFVFAKQRGKLFQRFDQYALSFIPGPSFIALLNSRFCAYCAISIS